MFCAALVNDMLLHYVSRIFAVSPSSLERPQSCCRLPLVDRVLSRQDGPLRSQLASGQSQHLRASRRQWHGQVSHAVRASAFPTTDLRQGPCGWAHAMAGAGTGTRANGLRAIERLPIRTPHRHRERRVPALNCRSPARCTGHRGSSDAFLAVSLPQTNFISR